jgi:hypothetical protein
VVTADVLVVPARCPRGAEPTLTVPCPRGPAQIDKTRTWWRDRR